MRTSVLFFAVLCVISIFFNHSVYAQGQPPIVSPGGNSGVFVQQPPASHLYPGPGALEFERTRLGFAPQSVGIQNCANIALTNTTDHPRLLTRLISLDPKHFSIPSPTQEMLPLTVGPNSSLYVNICFKADEIKSYQSRILAIFQGDTIHLDLDGRGVTPPDVVPVPKESTITDVTYKRHQWTIRFGVSVRSVVRLDIENAIGMTVKSFPLDDVKTPGYYEVNFDGKDDNGKKLAKGTYVLRLELVQLDSKNKVHSSRLLTIK
jgi:hypothetical protein